MSKGERLTKDKLAQMLEEKQQRKRELHQKNELRKQESARRRNTHQQLIDSTSTVCEEPSLTSPEAHQHSSSLPYVATAEENMLQVDGDAFEELTPSSSPTSLSVLLDRDAPGAYHTIQVTRSPSPHDVHSSPHHHVSDSSHSAQHTSAYDFSPHVPSHHHANRSPSLHVQPPISPVVVHQTYPVVSPHAHHQPSAPSPPLPPDSLLASHYHYQHHTTDSSSSDKDQHRHHHHHHHHDTLEEPPQVFLPPEPSIPPQPAIASRMPTSPVPVAPPAPMPSPAILFPPAQSKVRRASAYDDVSRQANTNGPGNGVDNGPRRASAYEDLPRPQDHRLTGQPKTNSRQSGDSSSSDQPRLGLSDYRLPTTQPKATTQPQPQPQYMKQGFQIGAVHEQPKNHASIKLQPQYQPHATSALRSLEVVGPPSMAPKKHAILDVPFPPATSSGSASSSTTTLHPLAVPGAGSRRASAPSVHLDLSPLTTPAHLQKKQNEGGRRSSDVAVMAPNFHLSHHQPSEQQQQHMQTSQQLQPVGRQARKQMRRQSVIDKQQQKQDFLAAPGMLTRSVSRMGQQSMRTLAGSALTARRVYQQDQTKMKRNATMRKEHAMRQIEHMSRHGDPSDPRHSARLDRLKTFVQRQVEIRNEGHKPVFAIGVTFIQMIILIAMLVTSKFASWGMGVNTSHHTVELLEGNTTQTLTVGQNPYFGPRTEYLIWWGSKWGACMRRDKIAVSLKHSAAANDSSLGCCVTDSGRCGYLSEYYCSAYASTTWYSPNITQANTTTSASSASASSSIKRTYFDVCASSHSNCSQVVLRPCCYGIYGQCAVISEQHCATIAGTWQSSAYKCGDVDCLAEACGMEHKLQNIFGTSYPLQLYRFVTAIFLHVGIIHFVMNALGQYVLVAQVEFVAGPWRTGVMYVLSGMCGFMISALFSASTISNGSSAAIYGMLGVETVDLFQTWQLLDDRFSQVAGLVIKLAIFLGIGTLPFIDNFAHVGGFCGGVVVGLWLLPFIVFNSADGFRKHALRGLSAIGLAALVVGLLVKFFTDDSIICKYCRFIDCIPFTPTICSTGG